MATTAPRKTLRLGREAADIDRAASILRDGGLVAFPTETVYGLGADATNDSAVAGIFEAKNRPAFNPLIVHVRELEAAEALAVFSDPARALAEAFWPGALTLVLPMREGAGVSELVTAGGRSLAIRMPDHPVAAALLAAADRPLAAPSANPSGRISPTTAAHVLGGLEGRIDAVVDGGPCPVGLESTIVGFETGPVLLREGGIPASALEPCLGQKLVKGADEEQLSAPGQLASHYAPAASLRLDATEPDDDEFMIGFGKTPGDITLSENGDLVEAAARLFSCLHLADESGKPIAVAPVPETGLGRAINDRLRRAAAPRGT
ncbi:MAG: L-threonylcarbamoyladenylate synthase [Paracoccaceae bacterium]|nr:L-threonylcarbamoyladenylate synthase [Paracoccaceae bacterium]